MLLADNCSLVSKYEFRDEHEENIIKENTLKGHKLKLSISRLPLYLSYCDSRDRCTILCLLLSREQESVNKIKN